jgi:outer membrane lipoprotein-sorting protein
LRRISLLFFLFLLGGTNASLESKTAQNSQKWDLRGVLGMMDRSAKDFHTLTADIEHIKYTDVVKDTSTESGQIYVERDEKMRIDFVKPDPRTILRTGDSLSIYTPKINRVEEYNLGKNREMVDQYVLLGFGTKSENLLKSYSVELKDEESLDERRVALLELTPKSEQMRKQITKIQVWIDEASWLAIEQKFYEAGSGDYLIFHYTKMMKNLKINPGKFKQDWPKNATRVKPRS